MVILQFGIPVVSVEAIMSGKHNNLYKDATMKQQSGVEFTAYFYSLINNAVMMLVRSLPSTAQTSAMMFFLRYAGIVPGQPLDFFKNYYSPVWSCIPHIIHKINNVCAIVTDEFVNHAATAHAMIMLLHSLDDHIHDGQIKPDHLILLIRSQMWKLLWDAITMLCSIIPNGMDIVNTCMDRYYASIVHNNSSCLEDYLHNFKDQMATGLIVPLITTQLTGHTSLQKGVRASLEHFGIAWRILDDIHDIEDDLYTGRISAVTLSLPQKMKRRFAELVKQESNTMQGEEMRSHNYDSFNKFALEVHNVGIVNKLVKRIIVELEASAHYAHNAGLSGLEQEINDLPCVWHINFSGIYDV